MTLLLPSHHKMLVKEVFLKLPISALIILFLFASGCAALHGPGPDTKMPATEAPYPVDTILDAQTGREVSFDEMIADLATVSTVYVGETHVNADHHEVQLDILKALYERNPDIAVGMEMFARPYQDVLSRWVEGDLSEEAFLRKTHWYATWRFDFALYREQLHYIRENGIPLKGLNIEFHIPSKIAAGGIDSLLPYQKDQVPDRIDLDDAKHRDYVKSVYDNHADHVTRHYAFEDFYAAQVVRDEFMAAEVSRHATTRQVVVFAGKGHIIRGWGIPGRAHYRTGLDYRTVNPLAAGKPVDLSAADYIWITSPAKRPAAMESPH